MTLKLSTIIDLWKAFGDIQIDEDERIEEPFIGFETGTNKEEIWHWFDSFIPVHDLLYDIQTIEEMAKNCNMDIIQKVVIE